MGLLDTIKSLLGMGDSSDERRRGDTNVTVERDTREAVNTETEAAVKESEPSDESASGDAASADADADTTTDADAAADDGDVESTGGAGVDRDEDAASSGMDAAASTDALVDEDATGAEAAEPAEAVGPESDDMDTELEGHDTGGDDIEIDEAESADGAESSDDMGSTEDAGSSDGSTGAETGASVDEIRGIGPAYADRLSDAGVETVADLAAADAATLADEIGVSETRVGRWIDRAKNR